MTDNKIIQVTIEDLAFDGKAVAHLDGKVVFLNGGLPGEEVEALVIKSKPRYNQAIVKRIITRAPERIDAICEHFDVCGGCTWQDLDYQRQLHFKQKQVRDCLERLGHLEDTEVLPIIGSDNQFFYRNKMEFSFGQPDDGDFTLGLHHRGCYDAIFDINQCHLQSEISNRLVSWFREWVRQQQIPVYHVHRHEGMMRFFMIRTTSFTDQVMVNIITNYGEIPEVEAMVSHMTTAIPEITTIVHNQNGQKSNIATGEIESVLYGPGYIEEELMESRFRIRSNSFFQTNSRQAEVLYRQGFEMLKATPTDRVLDLYCGTGTIGLLLAPKVAEVIGVELVADAVADARFNAGRNGVSNISFFEGNVKDLLRSGSLGEGFDTIIVDPPRAGINPKAIKQLIALGAPKVLYISCNPATFARDADKLCESGYHLPSVQPVDMFPHTMHIELVGLFTRN